MHIVYVEPTDGIERARKVESFDEAVLVIQALKAKGVDPTVEEDILNAKRSCLPLLVSPWRQCHIIPSDALSTVHEQKITL